MSKLLLSLHKLPMFVVVFSSADLTRRLSSFNDVDLSLARQLAAVRHCCAGKEHDELCPTAKSEYLLLGDRLCLDDVYVALPAETKARLSRDGRVHDFAHRRPSHSESLAHRCDTRLVHEISQWHVQSRREVRTWEAIASSVPLGLDAESNGERSNSKIRRNRLLQ